MNIHNMNENSIKGFNLSFLKHMSNAKKRIKEIALKGIRNKVPNLISDISKL